jgi:hypothetical protein
MAPVGLRVVIHEGNPDPALVASTGSFRDGYFAEGGLDTLACVHLTVAEIRSFAGYSVFTVINPFNFRLHLRFHEPLGGLLIHGSHLLPYYT